jgi:hypothetical protein
MKIRITPEQLDELKKPDPETIVDRLMGIYPSAVGRYKPSPLDVEAAGEILRLRAEIERASQVRLEDKLEELDKQGYSL